MTLQACDLRFSYPGGPELYDGLGLEVAPGERVALTAPSGSGKTTLCRLLAGFLAPTSGEVLVDATPLTPIERLRGKPSPVQLLWQHPEQAFDPRLRIGRSIPDGVDDLIRAFGVRPEWLTRRPHELSGGELMRLAKVRALACRPRYLIADESTAMLDAVTQAELWHVLMDLQARDGWGLVLVSHSPALLSRVATREIRLSR
ncbi:MAG: ATP-binding cassette domain-containing protein [Coriobacteriia bacterium]|nr:ATP-binding cassette domain-containing protein [Coriobacteriia bacterium]